MELFFSVPRLDSAIGHSAIDSKTPNKCGKRWPYASLKAWRFHIVSRYDSSHAVTTWEFNGSILTHVINCRMYITYLRAIP